MNLIATALYDHLKALLVDLDLKYSLTAIELADAAHAGQKRKFTGEDYIVHPVSVARKAIAESLSLKRMDEEVSIAICHDVIEDTETTIDGIKDLFPPSVVAGVVALTRMEGESYFDFIMRIRDTPYRHIKVWDIEDNMRDLKEGSLKDKYRLARYVLTHKP